MGEGGVHFRVWAPEHRFITVVFEPLGQSYESAALADEGGRYFSGTAPQARAGLLYRYCLDEGDALVPDPASRFQPFGPHGPSEIIDPTSFVWNDADWRGASLAGQILYEIHVGTFTEEGTCDQMGVSLPGPALLLAEASPGNAYLRVAA